MNLERHSIPYGSQKLDFFLKRSNRRTLAIHVHPNKKVEVVAPLDSTLEAIYQKIKKRARWVKRQQVYFERFEPLAGQKEFVSGETHFYLGRQYRLKASSSNENSVKLVGKYFLLKTDPLDAKSIKALLDEWYLARAKGLFLEKMETILGQYSKLLKSPKKVSIRRLAKRWGSCTQAGNIQLNLDLIKAPLSCIEYVIAHELCHLIIHDHSPQFYRLLRRFMPDWEKRKSRLDSFVF